MHIFAHETCIEILLSKIHSISVKSFLPVILFLIFGLFVLPRVGLTQVFQHISEKQEAPSGMTGGSQDKMGFIWFSTLDGLYRYDSQNFRHFKNDPRDSTSLAADYATSVFCDSRGDVWVCTMNGLCRYDPKGELFQTFKPGSKDGHSISSDKVHCIAEDKLKNLWIGAENGLNRVEIKDGKTKFTPFLQTRKGEPAYAVHGIATGQNQELWLATSNGLVLFDQGKARFFKAPADQRFPLINDFAHIFYDQAGSIWLGIRKGGLIRFRISSQTFEIISGFRGKGGEWPDISGFAGDEPGKVWIATMSGLANFDMNTLRADWYLKDPTNDHSPADNVLMSMFKDRQGGLWLSSYFGGIDYMSTASPAFSKWPFFIDRITKNIFTSSWMGITPDQRNWLLAGDKSKILFYDQVTNKLTSFNLDMKFVRNTNFFFVDEHDVLWCGDAGTLYGYDIKRKTTKAYPMPDFGRVSVEKNDLYIMIQDKQRQLWLGGGAGLLSFDKATARFRAASIEKSVSSIFEDSRGNLWFGGRNWVGILRDGRVEPERVLLKKDASNEDIIRSSVWRICEDPKGRIWLASAKGLRYYDPKNRQFLPVSNKFKVLVDGIGDVQCDQMGYLWIKGGEGLIRFHPDKGTIQSYNELDGLPKKAVITLRGAMKDNKGMLFYNTNQEMFSFNPEKVSTNIRPEAIVLSSLRLFNKVVKANDETGILDQEVSLEKELVFRHDQNVFSLDFALMSYARSHENRYRYLLEGFDREWTEGKLHSATYMNLPSGKYTFVVQAANGDGVWMKKPLKLKIVVLPPWWKTWYAYLFYFLVTGTVIYIVNRFFWIRSSFRKENALNQLKLEFFTNVSHEIRTHLSLISGPLETAFEESRSGKSVQHYLEYAKNNSDRLMLLVNELLDFRKISSGGNRLQVHEYDVVRIMKSILAAFEHIAKEKNIETSLICPETSVFLWFDIAQMQKVFYNLISNAYKFTPEGGKIGVRIFEISNEVNIVVEDNGRGISSEHLRKLFTYYYQADSEKPGYGIGLALSKSIVEQHRGYLTAESRLATESSPGGTILTIRMLRGNRHFSPAQIASQSNGYIRNVPFDTTIIPAVNQITSAKQVNTILIVEDNDELRAFIVEIFKSKFNTLEAENGQRGLELANEHIPDIILSDVMMPEMNGLEICYQLKNNNNTAHIPVVLLTARTQNEQIIDGLASGADDYIIKPFDPRILLLKINNLIRLRDDLKERYIRAVLIDKEPGNSIAQDINESFIARLRQLVTENISDPNFGVTELSLQVGMSVSVLYRKMRSLTGMTINEFVKIIRLHEAKKLLESGVYHVSEVSSMVGFEDSKYFSKEFKKTYGKAPKDVKRNGTD